MTLHQFIIHGAPCRWHDGRQWRTGKLLIYQADGWIVRSGGSKVLIDSQHGIAAVEIGVVELTDRRTDDWGKDIGKPQRTRWLSDAVRLADELVESGVWKAHE